ncbi:MAG TPA: hypothetical protein VES88_06785 [Gemmatimonadaceae bacterium]|nr:hypothetical protein [Gemmatimonadaceae bacterium]
MLDQLKQMAKDGLPRTRLVLIAWGRVLKAEPITGDEYPEDTRKTLVAVVDSSEHPTSPIADRHRRTLDVAAEFSYR